jgi:hypothetical protein
MTAENQGCHHNPKQIRPTAAKAVFEYQDVGEDFKKEESKQYAD